MQYARLFGKFLFLVCFIQSSFSLTNEKTTLISYQIKQLKNQVKEGQNEKQNLLQQEVELMDMGSASEAENKLILKLDQSKEELRLFTGDTLAVCLANESCENKEELELKKSRLQENVEQLEKKLSELLNANENSDRKEEQKQNEIELIQVKVVAIDDQISHLNAQIKDKEMELEKEIKLLEEQKIDERTKIVMKSAYQKIDNKAIDVAVDIKRKKHLPRELSFKTKKEAKVQAQKDARIDVQNMILKIGVKNGRSDGERDGKAFGQQASFDSSFQSGLEKGLRDGKVLAEIEGRKAGQKSGLEKSIEEIAKNAAERQAEFDIEESNVTTLAKRKGKFLGIDKATREGHSVGRAKGEAHAIDKFENRILTPIYVDGPFIGTFSPRTPEFHENYCQQYTCEMFEKTLSSLNNTYLDYDLNKLFKKSYINEFQKELRTRFLSQIDGVYLKAYTDQYNAAVEFYSQQKNLEAFKAGHARGMKQAKDEFHPLYVEQEEKRAFQKGMESDLKEHPLYKKLYKKFYRQFKHQYWNRAFKLTSEQAELESYRVKIDSEIVKSKAIRFAEVSDFYEKAPVLSFKYGKMKEIGIDGIGEADGIFQPGESLAHDIIIKNYGLEAARNIVIITDNNLQYKIDKIPASTEMHFKGIAKSVIPENSEGLTFAPTIEVFFDHHLKSPLSNNHYEDADRGLLGGKIHSPLQVEYPLELNIEQWDESLFLNEKRSIPFTMTNKSQKTISGRLSLILESNSQNDLSDQTFELELKPGESHRGQFEIILENENDLYRNLFVQGKIQLNQVTLGKTMRLPVLLKTQNKMAELAQKDVIFIAAGNRPQPIISQLMLQAKKKFAIYDSQIENSGEAKISLKNKSLILVHETEADLNQKLLTKIVQKNSNLLIIKNSQSEVKIPNTKAASIQLSQFDNDSLQIAFYQNENGILPVLISQPEMAKKATLLGQYLARPLGQNSIIAFKENSYLVEYFALKLLIEYGQDPTKKGLNKLLNMVNPTLREMSKKALTKAISSLDLKELSKVYLRLRDELQKAITFKIQLVDHSTSGPM
jgi:hypothetical protein